MCDDDDDDDDVDDDDDDDDDDGDGDDNDDDDRAGVHGEDYEPPLQRAYQILSTTFAS